MHLCFCEFFYRFHLLERGETHHEKVFGPEAVGAQLDASQMEEPIQPSSVVFFFVEDVKVRQRIHQLNNSKLVFVSQFHERWATEMERSTQTSVGSVSSPIGAKGHEPVLKTCAENSCPNGAILSLLLSRNSRNWPFRSRLRLMSWNMRCNFAVYSNPQIACKDRKKIRMKSQIK